MATHYFEMPAASGSATALTVTYTTLKREVGYFLGLSRDSDNYTAAQTSEIESIIDRGYRLFLNPPTTKDEDGAVTAHVWRFLFPTTTISLTASTWYYDLPSTFGNMRGDRLYFAADSGYSPVIIIGQGQILDLRARADTEGRPQYAAIRPKDPTGTAAQLFEIIFWPTPEQAYTLTYSYTKKTARITSSDPYPVGGEEHGETILQACLAMAERYKGKTQGPEWTMFLTMVQASMIRDKESNSASYVGDMNGGLVPLGLSTRPESTVTYNDVEYE